MLNEIFIKYREMVKNGNIFDEIYGKSSENCNKDVEFLKLQNILSLKATSWIAMVTHSKDLIGNEKFDEYENILKIYKQYEKNHQFFEFLGNDIDAGFRLAKEAYDGRHIISFELAYLLADQTEHMKNIYIITINEQILKIAQNYPTSCNTSSKSIPSRIKIYNFVTFSFRIACCRC